MFYNGQVGESIPHCEMLQRVIVHPVGSQTSELASGRTYICAQTIFVCR
jgi:hypothetical protein